jgi:myogenesis-regulating glycosidase
MLIDLQGPAGRMIIEDDGRIVFEREGRVALQSAPVATFTLLHGVEFPAQGPPRVERRGDGLAATYAVADPRFVVTLRAAPTVGGFRLDWAAPVTANVPALGVVWRLDPGGPWYGLGERAMQAWPLDRLPVVSDPLGPYDYAPDGTLNITTPLWLNAAGAAILAQEEPIELATTLDRGGDRLLRIVARVPEAAVGLDLDAPPEERGPTLALEILLADDAPGAHALAVALLGRPTSAPPPEMIARPIWTSWAHFKMAVTQADILAFAEAIVAHGYPRSVLEIDDRWQVVYGDATWDPVKFPEPRAMIDRLHALGFRVTLWTPPFFDPAGADFAAAAAQGYLVRSPADGAPALVRWWQGYGGLIDVTNPAALRWWRGRLGRLQDEYGVDGFKFDAGEANFVPRDRITAAPMLSRAYADLYVAWVAENFAWTEARTAWRAQRLGMLFREWDKWSRWGLDNGLHSVLTQALALSMIGYPFVLPDMIGGNAYGRDVPDAELMIRWTELNALLPAMQFSVPPWALGEATDAICRRYALLHEEFAPYLQTLIAETLLSGAPLVRPIFWHAPGDATALAVDDEFLLGARFLVAPVVQPGQTARDVYLPAGRWRDWWSGQIHAGPTWLTAFPAPLDTLPFFERLAGEGA